MTWFNIPLTFIKIKIYLFILEYICVFEYISTLHSFLQIYCNLTLYKMKWNNFWKNFLPKLYCNIICKNIVKISQKFEVKYTQTCTPLKRSIIWQPKGDHYNVFSPKSMQILLSFHINMVTMNLNLTTMCF
jgi:hypothetical protein